MPRYNKSRYIPKNPRKYVGDPDNIIARSSWERFFFHYLDTSKDIKQWSSEEISIPYVSPIDGKVHRYYPDIIFTTKDGETVLVEIKPKEQTVPPKKPKSKHHKKVARYQKEVETFLVNQAKWNAARAFADENGIRFVIITEEELQKMGFIIIGKRT